jgi:immune inhibitor A
LENRQRTLYDAQLPGDGLLIWHIDENQSGNTDENHYKVGLVQADGLRNLERDQNRGDRGDPYPGSRNNTNLTASTTPNSNSFTGVSTGVSIVNIAASGAMMSANITVSPAFDSIAALEARVSVVEKALSLTGRMGGGMGESHTAG